MQLYSSWVRVGYFFFNVGTFLISFLILSATFFRLSSSSSSEFMSLNIVDALFLCMMIDANPGDLKQQTSSFIFSFILSMNLVIFESIPPLLMYIARSSVEYNILSGSFLILRMMKYIASLSRLVWSNWLREYLISNSLTKSWWQFLWYLKQKSFWNTQEINNKETFR